MKKVFCILLAAALVFSLAACEPSGGNVKPTPTGKPVPTPTEAPVVIDDDVIKEKAPVLTVSGGDIQGYYSDDKTVRVYKGIPYAEAERFKAPVETSWEGVKDCTDWGPSCVQEPETPKAAYTPEFMGSCENYSENCLHLNVWTANDDVQGKPVIVYFHGGAYVAGNASCKVYEGKGVAQKGAVYVSINYRLGWFGFYACDELIAEDPVAAGNYAVLDWIAALKWVQENIEIFGGDPGNVTIMGQSAGANAVNTLTICPMAAGLFQRVASLSGNTVVGHKTSPFTQQDKVKQFKDAIKEEGLPELSLEELRALSDQELYKTYEKIWYSSTGGPCVDGVVIPDSYSNVMASGKANPVDIMVGTTANDLGGSVDGLTGDLKTDALTGETDLYSYAHAMGNYGKKTYTYLFTHVMPGKNTRDGAFHTSDVPYFLNIFSKLREEYWTEEDFALGDQMSSYLVNFARTGDPNGEGLPEWKANEPVFGSRDYSYMNLDIPCVWKTTADASVQLIEKQYAGLIQELESLSPLNP